MKRRTRLWVVTGSVLLALALAGVFVIRSSAPYGFLAGGQFRGTTVGMTLSSLFSAPPGPHAVRTYFVARPFENVYASAYDELLPEDGWERSSPIFGELMGQTTFRRSGEDVWLHAHPAGTLVEIETPATTKDRVLSWFWQVTH